MAREKLDDVPGGADALHVKYRPQTLAEIRGQKELVRSLSKALDAKSRSHAYLFMGPAGCGKTTLARIVAKELGVASDNTIEIDAATNTGIDAMRAVLDTLKYKGFGDSNFKMVIVDEAHQLSKAAWASMLKILEEPPTHVFFALCTTDPGRVPETIQTRCLRYTVKQLLRDDLFELLEYVCKKEDFEIEDDVLEQIVKMANGSARRALTGLSMVSDCRDAKEAAIVLSQPLESEDIIELCRALLTPKRLKWHQVIGVLGPMRDEDPEGLRLVIVNYLTTVLLDSDERQAPAILTLLSEFTRTFPLNRSEKLAQMLTSFGNICFSIDWK